MIRVTVWIERVQTSYEAVAICSTLEEARHWIEEDFRDRSKDIDFMRHGGYQVEEQVWKQLVPPQIIRTPSIQWVE